MTPIEIKTKHIPHTKAMLHKRKYRNGRTALDIRSLDGELMAVATVNLEQADVPEGHVLIKDYSENSGMLDALIGSGVISEPLCEIPTGFVMVQLCKLLV